MADNSILTRLDGLKLKYEEIGQKLTDPEVIADVKQFIQFNKEYRELEPIIEASERYRTAIANLTEAKDILANVSELGPRKKPELSRNKKSNKRKKLVKLLKQNNPKHVRSIHLRWQIKKLTNKYLLSNLGHNKLNY